MVTPADRLAALYTQVPNLNCIGLCHQSCGPIDMGPAEQDATATAGIRVPRAFADRDIVNICPALSILGQCRIYQARPMICRLWGAVEGMPCPHGCRPADGQLLTDEQGWVLLRAASAVR